MLGLNYPVGEGSSDRYGQYALGIGTRFFPLYKLERVTGRKQRRACTSGSVDALNASLPVAACPR